MSLSSQNSVSVWTLEGHFRGSLIFSETGVSIKLENGQLIEGKSESDIYYGVQNSIIPDRSGNSKTQRLKSQIRVSLFPLMIVRRPFTAQDVQFVENVFPPSTFGFYGKMKSGEKDALFIVQRIRDSERLWLTILNPIDYSILQTHMINPYEAEALALVEDHIFVESEYRKIAVDSDKSRYSFENILSEPSPSWNELAKIVEGISVPSLSIGKNVEDTLSQIIPGSFPDYIRKELMVFLNFVMRNEIPREDPIDFISRFESMEVAAPLITGHIMHLISKTSWPQYVKLMKQAERGELGIPKRAITEPTKNTPWFMLTQRCAELLPNLFGSVIDYVKEMNDAAKIKIGLPITKSQTKRSLRAWKKKFVLMAYGLRFRGHVNPSNFGLMELIYLGAAYRWPHRHMRFLTSLGGVSESVPHLQVMVMPPSAVERVRRVLPSVMIVDWSARTFNFDLYDHTSSKWIVPIQKILNSLKKNSSMARLSNQYGTSVSDTYQMSHNEAKVLDLIGESVLSETLDKPEELKLWGVTKKQVRYVVSKLTRQNVLRVRYEVRDLQLISLVIIVHGETKKITSLVSALLNNTPTSFARLANAGKSAVILTRLPEEAAHELALQLQSSGFDYGLTIRCMRTTTFQSYTHDFYQRLLKPDGSWDDDVSAFLSQARSRRKELSESNA
ncbi:MAG: hypothetical protein ACFFFO_07320 [Candidatus Thorarchaeota archaeon]